MTDLDMAARLVKLLRMRALADQRDPEHRLAAGYYYAQAKSLGRAIANARRTPTVKASQS